MTRKPRIARDGASVDMGEMVERVGRARKP